MKWAEEFQLVHHVISDMFKGKSTWSSWYLPCKCSMCMHFPVCCFLECLSTDPRVFLSVASEIPCEGQTLTLLVPRTLGRSPLGNMWMAGWWFGAGVIFPFSWECHNPNWRVLICFRGVGWNHQPDGFAFQMTLHIFMTRASASALSS